MSEALESRTALTVSGDRLSVTAIENARLRVSLNHARQALADADNRLRLSSDNVARQLAMLRDEQALAAHLRSELDRVTYELAAERHIRHAAEGQTLATRSAAVGKGRRTISRRWLAACRRVLGC